MKILVPLLFITTICINATTAQTQKYNQPLVDSLAKWAVIDQTAGGLTANQTTKLTPAAFVKYKDSVYRAHGSLLGAILARYGYPGYDLVGKTGSNNFWVMAQHCDYDPAFQEKILAAMKIEIAKHNADPKNFAFLTDRLLLNTGHKQQYGTQLTYLTDRCQMIPRPLADSLTVNTRRKELGMEPLEAYLNWMSQMRFQTNKAALEKQGIHNATLIPVPN